MSDPDSPAYPQDSFTPGVFEAPATGLTCREYAAIMLRVPDPNIPEWLNEMIRKARQLDAPGSITLTWNEATQQWEREKEQRG